MKNKKLIIFIVILIALIIALCAFLIINNIEKPIPGAMYDQYGNKLPEAKASYLTHILTKLNDTSQTRIQGLQSIELLHTFDKDDICISTRNIEIFDTNENALIRWNSLNAQDDFFYALLELDGNKITYTSAVYNTMSKSQILATFYDTNLNCEVYKY